MSAYEILNEFNKIKLVQPMTIYRTLKKLILKGQVHKSNQNKKFFTCCRPEKEHQNFSIIICRACGKTTEIVSNFLDNLLLDSNFLDHDLSNYSIEISAVCRRCG